MAIKKDNYSIKRYGSTMKLTMYIAYILNIIVAPACIIFGAIAIGGNEVPYWMAILLLCFGSLWTVEFAVLAYKEGFDPMFFVEGKKAVWDNQWKWVIISLLVLNITLIPLLTYANVMRKIYNTLLD